MSYDISWTVALKKQVTGQQIIDSFRSILGETALILRPGSKNGKRFYKVGAISKDGFRDVDIKPEGLDVVHPDFSYIYVEVVYHYRGMGNSPDDFDHIESSVKEIRDRLEESLAS